MIESKNHIYSVNAWRYFAHAQYDFQFNRHSDLEHSGEESQISFVSNLYRNDGIIKGSFVLMFVKLESFLFSFSLMKKKQKIKTAYLFGENLESYFGPTSKSSVILIHNFIIFYINFKN